MENKSHSILDSKDILQILLSEYSYIKDEMKVYIELFHKQTNYIILYFSVIAGFLSLNISLFNNNKDTNLPMILNSEIVTFLPLSFKGFQILEFFGYLTICLIGFYFMISIISYIYIIEILARRVCIIEKKINKLTGQNIMAWEITISPNLIRKIVRKGIWFNPSSIRITFSLSFLALIIIMLISTSYLVMGDDLAKIFCIFSVLMVIFFAIQFILYKKVGIPYITEIVNRDSTIPNIIQKDEDI